MVHLDGAGVINNSMLPQKFEPSSTLAPAAKTLPSTEVVPFHRTSKGIILFIVVGIVIVGAIIGGAVGGTLKSNLITQPSRALGSSRHPSTTVSRQGQSNGNDSPAGTAAGVETSIVTETTVVPSSISYSLPIITP